MAVGQGKSTRLSWPLEVQHAPGLSLVGGKLMPTLSQAFKHCWPKYQFPITWLTNTFFIQNDFRVFYAGLTMRASSKKTGMRSVAACPGNLPQSPG